MARNQHHAKHRFSPWPMPEETDHGDLGKAEPIFRVLGAFAAGGSDRHQFSETLKNGTGPPEPT